MDVKWESVKSGMKTFVKSAVRHKFSGCCRHSLFPCMHAFREFHFRYEFKSFKYTHMVCYTSVEIIKFSWMHGQHLILAGNVCIISLVRNQQCGEGRWRSITKSNTNLYFCTQLLVFVFNTRMMGTVKGRGSEKYWLVEKQLLYSWEHASLINAKKRIREKFFISSFIIHEELWNPFDSSSWILFKSPAACLQNQFLLSPGYIL